jgi:hypothetical protein
MDSQPVEVDYLAELRKITANANARPRKDAADLDSGDRPTVRTSGPAPSAILQWAPALRHVTRIGMNNPEFQTAIQKVTASGDVCACSNAADDRGAEKPRRAMASPPSSTDPPLTLSKGGLLARNFCLRQPHQRAVMLSWRGTTPRSTMRCWRCSNTWASGSASSASPSLAWTPALSWTIPMQLTYRKSRGVSWTSFSAGCWRRWKQFMVRSRNRGHISARPSSTHWHRVRSSVYYQYVGVMRYTTDSFINVDSLLVVLVHRRKSLCR